MFLISVYVIVALFFDYFCVHYTTDIVDSRSIKGVDDHVHITALSNARITLHNDDGLQ